MPKSLEGTLNAKGYRFCIVASRFNRLFTEQLAAGAVDCLIRHGAAESDIHIAWVPGSFEVPATARKATQSGRYHAVIALGTLIRGETPHFDYLAAEVSKGIAVLSLEVRVPVTFGILTCDTMDQAMARASAKQGNKGWDAALSAIEVLNLWKEMDETQT